MYLEASSSPQFAYDIKFDFTAPGVPPPPAYTQAIPEESGIATPTLPDPQTLPSNPDEIRARLHALRKKENERDAGLDFVDLR